MEEDWDTVVVFVGFCAFVKYGFKDFFCEIEGIYGPDKGFKLTTIHVQMKI